MRRSKVQKTLDELSKNPAGYFFYEDNYCDEMGCEVPRCDKHFGSVLSVEYASYGNGSYLGCIIFVGTVLDYSIRLNTRTGELTATNSIDTLKRVYDVEQCEAVDKKWADAYAVLMRR